MPGDPSKLDEVLRRLRIGAQGIAAIEQALAAPAEALSRADQQRAERSREQMRAALEDALSVQRRQMREAVQQGASEAEIAEAIGMTEEEIHRILD